MAGTVVKSAWVATQKTRHEVIDISHNPSTETLIKIFLHLTYHVTREHLTSCTADLRI